MAIDQTVYTSPQFRVGIAEEGSALGTAITAQGSFQELEITNTPWPIYSGIVRDQRKRADGKRVLSNSDIYLDEEGGVDGYTLQVEGILTDLSVDLLIYGVMQDLDGIEATATPFAKSFEWDGSTVGGLGRSSVGIPQKLFTINGENPATGEDWAMKSCVVKTLSINSDPATNGGRASFSATFWTGFKPAFNQTVTPVGNWTAPGTDYYAHQLLQTKTLAAADLVVASFSITFENNVARAGFDGSGNPEIYIFAGGAGALFDVTGELVAKYDPNTKDEIDKFVLNPEGGSAESNLILTWGDGSADGTLSFDVNAVYTDSPTPDFGNDAGVLLSLPFQGVDDGTNEAVRVTIANATDRGW